MLDVAISQLTTIRWDWSRELAQVAEHGFAAISLFRPKLSDLGPTAAAAQLSRAGVRVSSLQWAGGFTGSDGRSFAESVADAGEAIAAAATLVGTVGEPTRRPVVIVHSGCRGGHTRSHAARLLTEALGLLVPEARRLGIVLAIRPIHAGAAPGCSFLTGLEESLALVEGFGDPAVRLALDLWQFGDDGRVGALLPRLAEAAAVVQVADRCGPPTPCADRLPAGHGGLPLERLVAGLWAHGYRGDFEFDPVGEAVEMLGYSGVLRETRLVATAWGARLQSAADAGLPAGAWLDGGVADGALPERDDMASATSPGPWDAGLVGVHRRAGAGSRRSQASSQTVSRG